MTTLACVKVTYTKPDSILVGRSSKTSQQLQPGEPGRVEAHAVKSMHNSHLYHHGRFVHGRWAMTGMAGSTEQVSHPIYLIIEPSSAEVTF